MYEDLAKIIVLILAILLVFYFIFGGKREGLENATTTTNGEAGQAATYASNVNATAIALQDELLVSKYKKDYENVVVYMDDLVANMMLQKTLNININNSDAMIQDLAALNTLYNARQSLNDVMKTIDK